ncbi:MAG TPA: HPF/RaiA family ribosome-associated protein [Tepidisphaeraceae bacterium]|jgi:ribosomal subunit interface protein|nr:HPF/RaiA family ribosome-associated protein [Tepidisphaeraceae bacterium]
MQMTVHGLNFDLTTAILDHVRQRLATGLSYYAPRVQRVTVRVNDVNGPRGGADKRCRFEVVAEGVGEVRVDEVDADLYRAVDRAAVRLRRSLARAYGRNQKRSMGPRISASGLPT